MPNLTDKQKRKLEKLSKLVENDKIALLDYLFELEEKLDEGLPAMKDVLARIKGDKGEDYIITDEDKQEIIQGVRRLIDTNSLKGEKGDNYNLTDKDKREIAKSIKVPVVEKVIERTEVIHEAPIVTNEIKEVAVGDEPKVIADKLNTLEKAVDYKVIKGLPDFDKLTEDILVRIPPPQIPGSSGLEKVKSSGRVIKQGVTEMNFIGATVTPSANGVNVSIDPSSSSFEFYDIGEARRLSPDGILTRYKATADTDEARGTLLGLAQSEASSGDLIFVGPGTYEIAAVLGKDGVNWWFESGTLVQRVEGMIFSDGTENITAGGGTKMIYDVLGHGHFKSYGLAPAPMGGNACIGTSHDDSDIRVECDKIENYDIIGDSAVYCLKGTISIVANRIYSDVYDGVIASTDCKKLNVHADYIYGGQDALEFLGGQVKIWANTVVGVDHAILGYSGGPGCCVYLNAREITGQIDLGSGTDLTIIEAQITHDNGDPAIILKGDGVVLNNCRIVSSPATNSITTGGSAQSFCVVGTLYVDRPIHADVTANNGFVYDSVTNEISTNRTLKASDFKDLGLLSKPVLGTDGTGKIVESTDGTHYLSPTTGFKLDQSTPQTITGTPTFPHLHITGTNESSLKITSTGGTRIASIELVRSGNDYYDVKLKNEAAHLYLQYSADDGTNWTTYADFYYSKTILSTPLDLESNNITTLGSGLFGDGSTNASVTVKGKAFPVLSAERYNATGTGTYSVTNLARRYTGAGSVSAGYGVGQYFKLSVSDSTHDQFAGVFGARWNNVANKVGELVFTPAYGNDDPFNDVPTFLVRSTQAGGSQSIIIDSTNKLYATSGTFNFDNDDIVTTGTVASGGYLVGATAGIDTTFVDNDGNTITVTKGIITAKVAP